MTTEMKLLQDLKRYIDLQLDFEPASEWGKGAKDGFNFCKQYLDYLCELYKVEIK